MTADRVGWLLGGLATVGLLLACVAVGGSWDWPVVHDAALMHYLGWRIWEGDRPWVDVIDVNLPATYLLHAAWHGLTRADPMAWRALDLGLIGGGALAARSLVWPHGRHAAWLTAVCVVLLHVARGAVAVGQRDLVVGVLALAAFAWVAGALERDGGGRVLRLIAAGVALGWCVATKPTSLGFLAVAVGVALVAERARPARAAGAAVALLGGAAAVVGASLAWVAWLGVWDEMWAFWTTYMPLYRTVGARPWAELLLRLRETPALLLVLLAPVQLGLLARVDPTRCALLGGGLLAGVVHFVGQTKGYTYHLEPYALFAVPAGLIGVERAWTGVPWRTLGPATAAAAVVAMAVSAWGALTDDGIDPQQLAAARAIGDRLDPDASVVVLDLAQGGVQGLLYARARQGVPFLYDFFFYHDLREPIIRSHRKDLMDRLEAHPPKHLILFEASWPAMTYERVDTFPRLEDLIEDEYALDEEAHGYRWYRLRPR